MSLFPVTIPKRFLHINPSFLKNKGYSSPFFDNSCYFTTYGNNGTGKPEILSTWFRKGNIEIWYGLEYVSLGPMVILILLKNKIVYSAKEQVIKDWVNKMNKV